MKIMKSREYVDLSPDHWVSVTEDGRLEFNAGRIGSLTIKKEEWIELRDWIDHQFGIYPEYSTEEIAEIVR